MGAIGESVSCCCTDGLVLRFSPCPAAITHSSPPGGHKSANDYRSLTRSPVQLREAFGSILTLTGSYGYLDWSNEIEVNEKDSP